jgi:hypothetical protein
MSKTIQAQAMRGFVTPEQAQAQASAREAAAQAAMRKADALSLKLDNLTEIVKLAAFAAEARRTLTAVYGVMRFIPNMEEAIQSGAKPMNNWSSLQDNTGDVLVYVAAELEEVNTDFIEHAYSLAIPSEADSVTVTKGGEA